MGYSQGTQYPFESNLSLLIATGFRFYMKIQNFIEAHFRKRLEDRPVLVVYDEDKRYGDIVRELSAEEAYHGNHIVYRLRKALEAIWNKEAENVEQEICRTLGIANLDSYFGRPTGFFADHLSKYSKSRRKAPIYWRLSTESGSYTLWIYYHRLTDQTLFSCLKDFVNPKIEDVESDIEILQKELEEAGEGKKREKLEFLQDFRRELIDFRDEISRVAKLPYKPNLNDGVLITASPLWRLFRHRQWRSDLKACREKLEAGEYDWAHLAHSIWPERVERKCRKDLSIAIAHDLENLYEG